MKLTYGVKNVQLNNFHDPKTKNYCTETLPITTRPKKMLFCFNWLIKHFNSNSLKDKI